MITGIILCSIIMLCICVKKLWTLLSDPLWEFEPITDDEALLLTVVDEKHYADLLRYARTMEMSQELQSHLKDDKLALESISYYMLCKAAKIENDKKERWVKESVGGPPMHRLTFSERAILKRLKG